MAARAPRGTSSSRRGPVRSLAGPRFLPPGTVHARSPQGHSGRGFRPYAGEGAASASGPFAILGRPLAAGAGMASGESPPRPSSPQAAISLCGQSHFPGGHCDRVRGFKKWRRAQAYSLRAGASRGAQAHKRRVRWWLVRIRTGAVVRLLPRLPVRRVLRFSSIPFSFPPLLSSQIARQSSRAGFVNLSTIAILNPIILWCVLGDVGWVLSCSL